MVEWDGLENRCTGNCTEGSNPSLSAFARRSLYTLVQGEGELLKWNEIIDYHKIGELRRMRSAKIKFFNLLRSM